MFARRVRQTGRGSELPISLQRLPSLLGRSPEADVQLADGWVSRRPCQFEERDGVLMVKDLGSKHGTWVNHERVAESPVFPGDELSVGITTYSHRGLRAMKPPINTRTVTSFRALAPRPPETAPVVREPAPCVMPVASLVESEPKRDLRQRRPVKCQLGGAAILLGHLVASVLGLAIGYYVLCCIRPMEFNWRQMPLSLGVVSEVPPTPARHPIRALGTSVPFRTTERASEHANERSGDVELGRIP